jgi:N-acetyl-gamma-glutamyl-phosphate reductase
MLVEVPLHLGALPGAPKPAEIFQALADHYGGERFVEVVDERKLAELEAARGSGAAGYVRELDPESLDNTNRMRILVFGNEAIGQVRVIAILDNLGKGASGAAVQNMNLMLGLDEASGL